MSIPFSSFKYLRALIFGTRSGLTYDSIHSQHCNTILLISGIFQCAGGSSSNTPFRSGELINQPKKKNIFWGRGIKVDADFGAE
jgi:hypothetical protein